MTTERTDTERLDWLERMCRANETVEIGWAAPGHESGEYGEYLSSWPGGYFAVGCDVDGLYDHTSLRNAIDAAMEREGRADA